MTDPGGFELDRLGGETQSEAPSEWFEVEGAMGPIRGEVFRAHNAAGTVIICHGFKGFAHWGFFPHLAREIRSAGLNAITFDFSGSGMGADRESATEEERFNNNTFSAEVSDLDKVIATARAEGWLEGKFGLFGHSRGGGVAILHAGADENVGALVTWNSISHVNRWGAAEEKVWRDRGYAEIANSRTGQVFKLGTALLDDVASNARGSLDVQAAASRVKAPWLILHGKSDETVPPAEAESLATASKGKATLRLIEGNHGFDGKHPLVEVPSNLAHAVQETVSFFSEKLGK
ncbi:MAG: alpha/beta hydrolase [Gemmatimonadota bacterium]|nr:alpha/beta hydrolase [Gemmatimonadota bacterium]